MAITINWETKVISIPKSFMTLVQTSPSEIRSLDINAFHLALRDLEDSEDGMLYQPTHNHVSPVSIGGISLARVLEIVNGYTITFENGSYFARIDNGNSNIADVVNLNNVSVISSNSGGLVFNDAIEAQSFMDGRVYIDTTDGVLSTIFPAGTPQLPVFSYSLAETIALSRNFNKYELNGSITMSGSEILDSQTWHGQSYNTSIINLTGNSTENTYFTCVKLSGGFSGKVAIEKCFLENIFGFSGAIKDSCVGGNITIDSTNTSAILIIDSYSAIAGTARPVLDVNGANCPVNIRGYIGGLTVTNFNQGNNMSIDVLSGTVEIASSCTSGTIVIRGICHLIDNSNGVNIVKSGTITELSFNGTDRINLQQVKQNSGLIPALL